MKILLHYLKPHKFLVFVVLLLAAINISFSLIDPIIFGKLVNLATDFANNKDSYTYERFFFSFDKPYGVMALLLASIGVAMVSRIAKNFQDYFLNVVVQKFGAKVFTDGLQ
ncbi:MAG: ABC transporter ATP-binding protein, partial [Flavisolibacter sp.]|nr:ABC transporter ATP-binding protein [Flavisolibacter sp.]